MSVKKYWLEALGALLAAATPFVKEHIWDPPSVYLWLLLLLAGDGVLLSYHQRQAVPLLGYVKRALFLTFVLALAHNLGKQVETLAWLPGVVLLPTVLWHLRRLVRTGAKLGYVEQGVADMWELRFRRREEEDQSLNQSSNDQPPGATPAPDQERAAEPAAAGGP